MKVYICTMLALLVGAVIAGCMGSVKPQTPQQAVYAIEAQYISLKDAAVVYDQLPPCSAAVPGVLCSKAEVRQQIKAAKDVANPIIEAAEKTVRDPNFDTSTTAAIVKAAAAATEALNKIILTLQLPQVKAKTSYYMSALPAAHTAGAEISAALAILGLINQILALVAPGTAAYEKWSGRKTQFEQIVAEGRNPSAEEWEGLHAASVADDAIIDQAAAQP